MYPPSMLSSAALAVAAKVAHRATRNDYEFDFADLVSRLQILTRVENVSRKLHISRFHNDNLLA